MHNSFIKSMGNALAQNMFNSIIPMKRIPDYICHNMLLLDIKRKFLHQLSEKQYFHKILVNKIRYHISAPITQKSIHVTNSLISGSAPRQIQVSTASKFRVHNVHP